ncbi:MAG TPA: peptidylprolyl isomerase [Sphingomicrobium sp.]|nr:peptidylprolyl isomerase [Sphingomicrobium sp.]
MSKALFALPFLAMALIAAKPAPYVAPPSVVAVPAEVAADLQNRWTLDLSNGGHVVIQLRPDIAPAHVERIKTLTQSGFYNGLIFHRVIAGFMAQTGDPTGTGQGGSKLPDLKAEFNALPHLRGTVAMARATEDDSANSQFFIMFGPKFALDHHYTAFGRVIEGMAAVDAIAAGEPPAQPTKIVNASLGAAFVPAVAPVAPATLAPDTTPASDATAAPAPVEPSGG